MKHPKAELCAPAMENGWQNATSVLKELRRRGVRLWCAEGRLRYTAPKGAMTAQDLIAVGTRRAELIALLQDRAGSNELLWPRDTHQGKLVPLTFSQLAHWKLYDLGHKRSVCIIPMVMRISGRLDLDAFKASASRLLDLHEALRTRIKVVDASPMQEVPASWKNPLSIHDENDPVCLEARAHPEVAVSTFIPRDVDICHGPLFAMHLLVLRDAEYILTIHMEHIISDGWSMGIVWRDLFKLYGTAVEGVPDPSRGRPLQFAAYAEHQRDSQDSWVEVHRPYWQEHLSNCPRVRFPVDGRLPLEGCSGWAVTRFCIPAPLAHGIAEWGRRRCTTAVIAVFTAYVAFALRWCDVSEMVVLFQTEGRSSPDSAEAVGYFAFPLYLRMQLLDGDDFLTFKDRIVEEYVSASEHADHSWLESRSSARDFVRNTRFNWLPDSRETVGVGQGLTGSVIPGVEDVLHQRSLLHLERDTEPMMGIVVRDGDIEGEWLYPASRFCTETMAKFVQGFLSFLEALVSHPDLHIRSIPVNR